MCRAKAGLSRMQEWIFLNFSVKRSKFLTVKSFVKLSGYCIFLYHFKLLRNIFNLIPHLLYNSISRSNMAFIYVISTNLVDIEFI